MGKNGNNCCVIKVNKGQNSIRFCQLLTVITLSVLQYFFFKTRADQGLNGWDNDMESIQQTQRVCIVKLLYKKGFNVGLFQLGYIR